MDDLIKKVEKNLKKNREILNKFELKMLKDGTSIKEIKKHIDNVEFYINDFLPYYSIIPAEKGCSHMKEFFSDWFIRKALWSSPKTVEENIDSLTRFYGFMYDNNEVRRKDFLEMMSLVNKEKSIWVENG